MSFLINVMIQHRDLNLLAYERTIKRPLPLLIFTDFTLPLVIRRPRIALMVHSERVIVYIPRCKRHRIKQPVHLNRLPPRSRNHPIILQGLVLRIGNHDIDLIIPSLVFPIFMFLILLDVHRTHSFSISYSRRGRRGCRPGGDECVLIRDTACYDCNCGTGEGMGDGCAPGWWVARSRQGAVEAAVSLT